MKHLRLTVILSIVFAVGLISGGYLFRHSLPRSFLAFDQCANRCYRPSDLAGLLTSAAIQQVPGVMPSVELESDECLAIRHPVPQGRVHYVLFPKRDVRNIGELTAEDQTHLMGCFAVVHQLVKKTNLRDWRLYTNGPGLQDVAYLHFHLLAREKKGGMLR